VRGSFTDLGVGARAKTARRLRPDVDPNSTPVTPASTMRLTAFVPPPPTPTTLITAK
jgi:hypothetical protein